MKLTLALLFLAALAVRAEDWTTTDGKTYKDVTVCKVEVDAVTILHSDGGAVIPLEVLPPNLQAKFHYDPVKAKAAYQKRLQDDYASAEAAAQAQEQEAAQRAAQIDAPAPAPSLTIPEKKKLSAAQVDRINVQIGHLEDDVAMMQRSQEQLTLDHTRVRADEAEVTRGAYDQKILDEQAEIIQLKQQLAADAALPAATVVQSQ